MKIRTVALLASAAMTLTSLTVWSLTAPGGYADRAPTADEAAAGALRPAGGAALVVAAAPDAWRFDAGTTLRVEGRLGHSVLLADRDNESYLFVDVNAPPTAARDVRAPLDLSIAIDRSGSMRGKRLDNAIAAAKGAIQRLRDGDVVSVVSFDTRVTDVLPPTNIDDASRGRALRRLDDIVPGGDTCISCALERTMSLVRERSGMVARVLLLSDGEATAGVRDVNGFRAIAGRMRDMGCTVTTIGVDVEYNERIMSAVALESNGRHYFVDRPSDLPRVFDAELQSLIRTVAKDAELRVALAPGIEVAQVFDRSFRRVGNDLVVPLGSFAAEETKTLLVRLRVPRGAEGKRPVADVRLGFDDLVERRRGSCEGTLALELTADPTQVSPLDPLVLGRLGRSTTSATLNSANELFSAGARADARGAIDKARREIEQQRDAAAASAGPAGDEVRRDFDRQLAALDDAQNGFAEPPAPASAASPLDASEQARPGKAQVRANAAEAVDLAF